MIEHSRGDVRKSSKQKKNTPARSEETRCKTKATELSSDPSTTTSSDAPEHERLGSTESDKDVTSDTNKPTMIDNCIQIHEMLEFMRDAADFTGDVGPVVLIAGRKNIGKKKVLQELLDRAVSSGRTPVWVNLNVSEGFFPQTMGLSLVRRNVEDDSIFSLREAKLNFFGSKDPAANYGLYLNMLEKVSEAMSRMLRENKEIKSSGAIINTCGWVARRGHELLRNISKIMKAKVVIVTGDKTLHKEFRQHTPKSIQTRFVPVPETITESQEERDRIRDRVKDYFHQPPVQGDTEASHSFDVPFRELKIYRSEDERPFKFTQVLGVDELTQLQVLAVFAGPVSKNKALTRRAVEEFMYIVDIDVNTSMLTLLSRRPRPLSKELVFIATNLQYTP